MAEKEVSLADSVRGTLGEDAGADGGELEAKGGEAGAAGAAAESGAKAEDAGKPEAEAGAAPEITDELLEKFSSDPRVIDAVLRGDAGQQTLNELFKEVISEQSTTAQKEAAARAQAATIDEAVTQYQETGDASAFGELVIKQYLAQKEAKPIVDKVTKEVSAAVEADTLNDLNAATMEVYGDIIEGLTDADYTEMARENFPSRQAWMTGVFKKLDAARQEGIKSESSGALSAAEEAAKTAAAAGAARVLAGVGALPGGTGVEKAADSDTIGGLLRTAMSDALAGVEEAGT